MTSLQWLVAGLTGYLIGSLPSAFILGRILQGVDIRERGDGNAGAANAYKVLGRTAGILVAMADIGKGAAAVLLTRYLAGGGELLAGVMAVAGHNWPIFLHLRGGRGAATALGVLLVIVPMASVPLTIAGLLPFRFSRSMTVALAFIFISLPLVTWWLGMSLPLVGYTIALPVLVGISHFLSARRWANRATTLG